jgi:hypothetical protein
VLGAAIGDDFAALAHDVADQLAVGLRDEVELRDEGGVGADPMDDEGFLAADDREVPEGVEGELTAALRLVGRWALDAELFDVGRSAGRDVLASALVLLRLEGLDLAEARARCGVLSAEALGQGFEWIT